MKETVRALYPIGSIGALRVQIIEAADFEAAITRLELVTGLARTEIKKEIVRRMAVGPSWRSVTDLMYSRVMQGRAM